MLTSLSTVKGLAFLLIKFPLGIVSFVVSVLTVALTLGLFFAPLYYQSESITVEALGIGQVDTIGEAFLVSGFGLLTGIVTLPLTGLLAKIWRGLATLMLGSGSEGPGYVGHNVIIQKPKRILEDEYLEVVHVAKPIRRQVLDTGTSPTNPGREKLATAIAEEQQVV